MHHAHACVGNIELVARGESEMLWLKGRAGKDVDRNKFKDAVEGEDGRGWD